MRPCRRLTATLLAFLTTAMPAHAGTSVAPEIRTASGTVQGASADGIDMFKGIPYAAPPVGDLRWRMPRPVTGWTDVRPATAPGPDCLQDSKNNPLDRGYVNPQSEDCLYLNVWRPAGAPAKPLPVMVWIHGGGFIMGTGSMPSYDGAALARQGAVLITINYRLGRFGTFAHPALDTAQGGEPLANFGTMDQIAALKWVQANVRAFGGDPRNVTIFGESAGASSVNFLMQSPLAHGLFAKAISESGGSSAQLKTLQGAEQDGLRWASAKGVAPDDVKALRALPAETVLDAPVVTPAFPVLDGKVLLRNTVEAFRDGAVAPVPYIVGANGYEESLLRWLPGGDAALLKQLGDRAEPLIATYTFAGEDRARGIARLWGESGMTEPARRRARQHSAAAPTWLYRFDYVPETLRATRPGAGHGDEVEMVLGNPSRRTGTQWTPADKAMSALVGSYWVSFAKTGDPNHAGAPQWPRFTPKADRTMIFDNKGAAAVTDFGRARLDALEAAMTRAGS